MNGKIDKKYQDNTSVLDTSKISSNASFLRDDSITQSRQAHYRQIVKAIKNNDVNPLIGNTSNLSNSYVPNYNQGDLFDEAKEIHENLNQTRKEYDGTKEKSQRLEKEIQTLRAELDVLRVEEDLLKSNQYQLNSRLDYLQNQYDTMSFKQEEAIQAKKTFEHMIERMKSDEISYKIKLKKAEGSLDSKRHRLNDINFQNQKTKQFNLQSKMVLDEMLRNIEIEHNRREEELKVFKKNIEMKQSADKKRDERVKRQQEIAESAANDWKDGNEKKWKKLLLVHKFLNVFLKQKMEREMKNFETTERYYQKIKAQTGISDTDEICHKFLNREETYGEVLIKIADYEKKIESLSRENDKLKESYSKVKSDYPTENLRKKVVNDGNIKVIKELDEAQEKYRRSKVNKDRLHACILRYINKIAKTNSEYGKINYYDLFSRDSIPEAFAKLNEMVTVDIEEMKSAVAKKEEDPENLQTNISKSNILDETMADEFQKRNVRVRPELSKRDISFLQESMSKATSQGNASNSNSIRLDSDEETNADAEELEHFEKLRRDVRNEKEPKPKEVIKRKKQQL